MVNTGSPAQHAEKSREFAVATRLLIEAGMPVRAASDAYYLVFHLAEALLATIGASADTHAGVHKLLARDFVKNGPLARDVSQRFTHLMGDRHNADHGVDGEIEEIGAQRAVISAAILAGEMLDVLETRESDSAITALRRDVDALLTSARPLTPP